MKKNFPKIIIGVATLIVATSCTPQGGTTSSSSSSSSLVPVTITSLKEGMKFMNSEKNFTLAYTSYDYLAKPLYTFKFSEKAVGFVSDYAEESLDVYVDNNNGIFKLNCDEEDYLPGEYVYDKNGEMIKGLWNNNVVKTFYNVSTDYINSISDDITELDITNKVYIMRFLEVTTYSPNDYVDLDYLKVTYAENRLNFELKFIQSKKPEYYVALDFNNTKIEAADTFLKYNGKALELNEELQTFRTYFKGNNFTREVYDFSSEKYVGSEFFNEHYFYSESYNAQMGNGALECNCPATEDHPKLYGCYYFLAGGNTKTGFSTIQYIFPELYKEPKIEEFYHYPCFLSMWDNMQFLKEDTDKISGYRYLGDAFCIKNSNLLVDFAKNFSINESFPITSYVPYKLGIDIHIDAADDSKTRITFLYCFNDGTYDYMMPIPFSKFGETYIDTFDKEYAKYNV